MYTTDDSLFPIVMTRMTGAMSSEDLTAIEVQTDALLTRRQPYVTINDGRLWGVPDSVMRRQLAETTKRIATRAEGLHIASAIVLGNAALIGAMTAVRWIAPPPVPEKYVSTASDALAFVRTVASARDLVLPSGVDALVAAFIAAGDGRNVR